MAPLTSVEQALRRVETTWRNYELAIEQDLSQTVLGRLLATHHTAMYAYLAAQECEAQVVHAQQVMPVAQAISASPSSPVVQASLFGDDR